MSHWGSTLRRTTTRMTIIALAVGVPVLMVPIERAGATAQVTLKPGSGTVGSSVTATGSAFPARQGGTVTFGSKRVASFRTTNQGAFSVSFRVPSVPPGQVPVTAAVGTSSVTATYSVQSNPTSASKTPTTSTSTTVPSTTTTTAPSTTTTTVPPSSSHFSLLPPGSALPSDSTCASQIHAVATATAEPRPDNNTPNHTVPGAGSFSLGPMNSSDGYDDRALNLENRVDGNFKGTTDQIIQWASCKWGWDEDVVRAMSVQESQWHMSQLGDYASGNCPPGYSAPCPYSFGIEQDKWTSNPQGNFPWTRDSTAFNLDVSLMQMRVCYEGYTEWMSSQNPSYTGGDMWGCVGAHYGGWHDSGSQSYISDVQTHLAAHPWTSASF